MIVKASCGYCNSCCCRNPCNPSSFCGLGGRHELCGSFDVCELSTLVAFVTLVAMMFLWDCIVYAVSCVLHHIGRHLYGCSATTIRLLCLYNCSVIVVTLPVQLLYQCSYFLNVVIVALLVTFTLIMIYYSYSSCIHAGEGLLFSLFLPKQQLVSLENVNGKSLCLSFGCYLWQVSLANIFWYCLFVDCRIALCKL